MCAQYPERTYEHFESAATPCRHTTHRCAGVEAVGVERMAHHDIPPVELLRCTVCQCWWWRDKTIDRRRLNGEFGW